VRKIISYIAILCFYISATYAGDSLRFMANNSFTYGEKLVYRIHYGIINAGETVFEVKEKPVLISNRRCYHVIGTGKSTGAFNWFFKVRDTYESYIDQDAILPWKFIRDVYEGGYTIYNKVSYDRFNNTLTSIHKTYKVPFDVQDVVSAIYYFRALDYSNIKPNQTFPFTIFLDEKVYKINVTYLGKEIISSKFGKVRCLKFKPQLIAGTIFNEDADMFIWVSDDKNKIPIRIQSEVLVGSIKADIRSYKGLLNKFTSIID